MPSKKNILRVRYDIVVSKLEAIHKLSQSELTSNDQIRLFKLRCMDLESIYNEFTDLHVKLSMDLVAESENENHQQIFDTWTDYYYLIKLRHSELFPSSSSFSDKTNDSTARHAGGLNLPNITLPTFSGQLEEYTHYMDLFKAMIDTNQSLTDAQKMYYLYGSLSGEAKSLVQHLSITGKNYSVLLDILQLRYGNPRLQADKLLHSMLSLPNINKGLTSLKSFLNILLETSKGLEKLKFPVKEWSYLLLFVNLNKLEGSLKRQFEDKYGGRESLPTFDEFIEFLTREVQLLETTNIQRSTSSTHRAHISYENSNVTREHNLHANSRGCTHCKGPHHISKCQRFANLKTFVKKQFVVSNRLCFRCLNSHYINDCRQNLRCSKCHSGKHHTLLHLEPKSVVPRRSYGHTPREDSEQCGGSEAQAMAQAEAPADCNGNKVQSMSNSLHAVSGSSYRCTVLLSTAVVRVCDCSGIYREGRALIDSGSQSTFVTEEFASHLGLRVRRSGSVTVKGIGGHSLDTYKGNVYLKIIPQHVDHPVLVTSGLVINKVADNLPACSLPSDLEKYYKGLRLADEQFYKCSKIDLLIGADLMGDIINGGIVRFEGLPSAMSTIFGYVLMGPVASNQDVEASQSFHVNTDTLLERFWEVEEVPTAVLIDPKEEECESHFRTTHSRNPDGRYVVRLPFLSEPPNLGDSAKLALRRFLNLERRFKANSKYQDKYIQFMREYIDMGHMVPSDGYEDSMRYVIPHHGIFKTSSDKIRVVFDASCATSSGVSLNDILHAGPRLQRDVMQIIMRFRLDKVVFTTDIKMMFRMIDVHKEDRKYQLIYWREAPDAPLLLYELKTVTYGMKSSPYLAIRTLRQLADDGEKEHPDAAKILRTSVYMDDILGGGPDLESAQRLKSSLKALLASGKMELRKWVSNDKRLLEDVPEEHQEKPHVFDSDQHFVKILGVQWNPVADTFTYHLSLGEGNNCTKRAVLSTIARMFDPMGWIGPVIFQGKVLMQRLWSVKLSWDERPPPELVTQWESIVQSLPALERVRLKRFVLAGNITECSLQGFSDASELGYGVAVYIRTVDDVGKVRVSLLMGKSRVAPIKSKLTIPKLELCGAALLVKVFKYVREAIGDKISVNSIVGWSDSTIVLSWLRVSPHLLQTFEGNRVSQIINSGMEINWRYIPSEMNPADVASRGCRAHELLSHPLWWEPLWLLKEEWTWPADIVSGRQEPGVLPGLRKADISVHAATTEMTPSWIFTNYSPLSKLIAVIAYCFRFTHNAIHKHNRCSGVLSAKERSMALDRLIMVAQSDCFMEEKDRLQRGKPCSVRLRRLLPFVDAAGLVRVGGRLEHSSLPYASKHPMLLPKSHPLTRLIIDHYHKLHCHVGPTALQAILQKRYWILSARQAVRSQLFRCMYCFKTKPRSEAPVMADLPSDRVNPTGVFHTVQTDFAGPYTIKTSRLRKASTTKAYLCVFVCSASRAVHLEVVSDLSTDSFLATLSRFVARRGLPGLIRSDCGTNYIGSHRHLNEVQRYLASRNTQEELCGKTAQQGITWQFNPPAAPHFGGLFEAAVKSAKTLLSRVIGNQVLTFEELTTVFARIEAVLNSRPLCPLSQDVQENEVLTPAHFLIGRSLLEVPEYNWEDIPDNRLSRYQLVQAITQRFWKRWSDQYLHSLQMRLKWTSQVHPQRVGELVLIKEDALPPLQWRRARVVQLLPGRDGVVRVATLRTSSGQLTRPVTKLCRLPVY